MNVLVTGGAGFIGTNLVRGLISSHEVTVVDCFSSQIHGENDQLPEGLQNSVRLVRGDVRDAALWAEVLPGQDAVVHLAAETGTGQSMYEVSRYEEVNLSGTALLCEELVKGRGYQIERLVVASSRAIYGEGAYRCKEHGLVYPDSRSGNEKRQGHFDPICPSCLQPIHPNPTPESAPLQPSSFYGLTKQVQEQMVLMFGRVLGISAIGLRYQNVFGPGQSLENPYTGILAVFSNLARQGRPISVFEDGEESRDFVYIDDVVEATKAALIAKIEGSHSINVGSGDRTTVLEVARGIIDFYGSSSEVKVTGSFREGDIRHGCADLKRAESLLGYKPKTSFCDGLQEFLRWAQERGSVSGASQFDQSLEEMREHRLLHD